MNTCIFFVLQLYRTYAPAASAIKFVSVNSFFFILFEFYVFVKYDGNKFTFVNFYNIV